ncbi:hypothetical protein KAX75_05845 [candidate division WOR-3 bacterium]|nr:hypothetical protein [candidate division WOR-3 bacterium]
MLKVITFLCLILPSFCLNAEFIVCGEPGIQYEPSIGFDGTNFFVIWSDSRDLFSNLFGTRITQSGTILDPGGIRLLQEFDNQTHPSIAFDGSNYLATWQYGC